MNLNVGDRLGSSACTTEVIVVRAPSEDVDLTCGWAPLSPLPVAAGAQIEEDGEGTLVGKRYEDPESGLELLCTKGGVGLLRIAGTPLVIKSAKSLPSSD